MSKKKNYQTGGLLPNFDFASIRQPIVPRPINEFGTLVNRLNQDFDTGIALNNDLLAQATALESSPFEEDKLRAEVLKRDALNTIDNIRQEGDFENQVTNIKRLAGDFNRGAIPLLQRRQQFDKIVERVNRDPRIIDKDRVIRGIIARENLNPTLTTNPETGVTFSNLNPERFNDLISSDIDAEQIFQKAANGVVSRLRSKNPELVDIEIDPETGQTIKVLRSGQREVISRNEMREVLEQERLNNPELQSFITREEQLSELLGEDIDPNLQINQALESVLDARSGVIRDLSSDRIIPNSTLKNRGGRGSGVEEMTNAIIRTNTTPAFKIRDVQNYRDLLETEREFAASQDTTKNAVADSLRKSRERFEEQALKGLTDDERKIYDEFVNDQETINLIDRVLFERSKNFFGGGKASNKTEQEVEELKIRLEEKGITINKFSDITDVLGKARSLIEKGLEDIKPLSREYDIFSADDEGLGKANVGQLNDLLNKDIGSQNYSIVENFGINRGRSFNEFFKNTYLESGEFDDFRDIRFEARTSDGISLQGIPFSSVTVLGTDEENRTIQLGQHLVAENKEEAWNNYERLADALFKDGFREKAFTMKQKSLKLGDGRRLGEIIAITNISGMRDSNDERIINLGSRDEDKLTVSKDENGIMTLLTNKGTVFKGNGGQPIQFRDEEEILSYLYAILTRGR